VAILFPIFAIVAAGYFYGRKHKPEMAVASDGLPGVKPGRRL